jgi:hypothetical protein
VAVDPPGSFPVLLSMARINGGGMQGKVALDGSGEYTCNNSAGIWPVRLSFFFAHLPHSRLKFRPEPIEYWPV